MKSEPLPHPDPRHPPPAPLVSAGGAFLRLEEAIAARAKAKQHGGQGGILLPQKSAEANPIETREELAKLAGVSRDTVDKVRPQAGILNASFVRFGTSSQFRTQRAVPETLSD